MKNWNEMVGERIIFRDKNGRIWDNEDMDKLDDWEVERLGLHVSDNEWQN